MDPDKCAEIREAHQIVREMMGEYKTVMDAGQKLLDSLDLSASREALTSHYFHMNKLAHYANVQIARSCKSLFET